MRRLLLAMTIPLAGCDILAGRPLAPEERCVWRTVNVSLPNAAGDTVPLAGVRQCLPPS